MKMVTGHCQMSTGRIKKKKSACLRTSGLRLCDHGCELGVVVRVNRFVLNWLTCDPISYYFLSLSSSPTDLLAASGTCHYHFRVFVLGFLLLECPYSRYLHSSLPLLLQVLFKCHFLDEPCLNWPPGAPDLPYPALFLFFLSTYSHQ